MRSFRNICPHNFLQVRQRRLNNLPKVMQLEVAVLRGQLGFYDSSCLTTQLHRHTAPYASIPGTRLTPAIVPLANHRELLSCWGVRTFPPPVL